MPSTWRAGYFGSRDRSKVLAGLMQCGIACEQHRSWPCIIGDWVDCLEPATTRLVLLPSAGFCGGNDGLLQHFENPSRVLVAQSHCHRFGVDGLGQRE